MIPNTDDKVKRKSSNKMTYLNYETFCKTDLKKKIPKLRVNTDTVRQLMRSRVKVF
jgi:hypothetical protein